jgi:hypothetical protein
MDWISRLRAPQIAQLAQEHGPFQPSLFDERNLLELTSEHFPGERLVVCRNPLLAEERSRQRGELLAATEAELATVAALDGLYVIRTSLGADKLAANAAVAAYKSLSQVERAFRSIKTVDLKVRPVFHYSAERVRAHVFLCMLAYYVEWHMRRRLKPMLFDDEFIDAAPGRETFRGRQGPAIGPCKGQGCHRTRRRRYASAQLSHLDAGFGHARL